MIFVLGAIAAGAAVLLVLISIREWGYHCGHKHGYAKGRYDADNWWIGIEQQTDQARQKIWREHT